jgi:hypothetical protein
MALRDFPEKFLVAFSFAGEQREIVRRLAEEVEHRLGRSTVFYDDWYLAGLAGHDADTKLHDIYRSRCELVVVCVSKEYGEKVWTSHEHRAVRERYFVARTSAEKDAVLPVRVGDGDVEGILATTIAPDLRRMPFEETVELIVGRLCRVCPSVQPGATDIDWPEEVPDLRWPMADHAAARSAFGSLLTRSSPNRILLICGASETGKSHMSKQMWHNGMQVPGLACGRFDFKGMTNIDGAVDLFASSLDQEPPPGERLTQRLGNILIELRRRHRPTLLILDTYEAAADAQDWTETVLLQDAVRSSHLRVVALGQTVPRRADAVWEPVAAKIVQLSLPSPEDWYAYSRAQRPEDDELTLDFVTIAHRLCGGRPTALAPLCGPR